jgi:predicted RNA-binding Zn-ribbon protein involved in translation (DUF1610 family)
MTPIPKNLRCPKCGSLDIAEILYGPVEMTADIIRMIQAKNVLIRNEPQKKFSPRYYCNYCGYEW